MINIYGVKHWILPVAKRVYIIVDKNRKIIYKKDTGFGLLENQTETLLKVLDTKIQ